MQRLLAPLTAKVGDRVARSPLAPVGRRIAGTEMGMLLGWAGKRVLGQYDLLVPDDPDHPSDDDAVYYVGPNVLGLEKRYAFRPRDFRLWIALHELTHRAQFTGVPWLRPYFLSLVEQSLYAGRARPDPAAAGPRSGRRRSPPRPQPARRRRSRRPAARLPSSARSLDQTQALDVAARRPRQPGDEPTRSGTRRRPGADGAHPAGPPQHRRRHRPRAEAARVRDEDASVRDRRALLRRRRRRSRSPRARCRVAGAGVSSRPSTSSISPSSGCVASARSRCPSFSSSTTSPTSGAHEDQPRGGGVLGRHRGAAVRRRLDSGPPDAARRDVPRPHDAGDRRVGGARRAQGGPGRRLGDPRVPRHRVARRRAAAAGRHRRRAPVHHEAVRSRRPRARTRAGARSATRRRNGSCGVAVQSAALEALARSETGIDESIRPAPRILASISRGLEHVPSYVPACDDLRQRSHDRLDVAHDEAATARRRARDRCIGRNRRHGRSGTSRSSVYASLRRICRKLDLMGTRDLLELVRHENLTRRAVTRTEPLDAGITGRLRGPASSPVVVACSGGADSLALLALAVEADLEPVAVHVDHGLRPGSGAESPVRRASRSIRLGAGFCSRSRAVAPGPNLEARARERALPGAGGGPARTRCRLRCSPDTPPTTRPRPCSSTCCGARRPTASPAIPARRGALARPLLGVRRADTHAICRALDSVSDRRPDERRPGVPPGVHPSRGAARAGTGRPTRPRSGAGPPSRGPAGRIGAPRHPGDRRAGPGRWPAPRGCRARGPSRRARPPRDPRCGSVHRRRRSTRSTGSSRWPRGDVRAVELGGVATGRTERRGRSGSGCAGTSTPASVTMTLSRRRHVEHAVHLESWVERAAARALARWPLDVRARCRGGRRRRPTRRASTAATGVLARVDGAELWRVGYGVGSFRTDRSGYAPLPLDHGRGRVGRKSRQRKLRRTTSRESERDRSSTRPDRRR